MTNFLNLTRVSEEYKKNPGAVEAIAEQPGNQNHILIAYNRGLIVLWDRSNSAAVKVRLFFSTKISILILKSIALKIAIEYCNFNLFINIFCFIIIF